MKIHSIQLKNFKQFSELSIERDSGGDIYLIGDNDKGKTTIIQAIFGCLKQISLPTSVIKNGEKEGEVHLKIGDNAQEYHVKLRMTEKGETLTLTSKDGAKYSKPITKLQEIVGDIIYNVFELSDMKPQEQIVWVQEKFKIDINDIKVAYKKVYDERRDLNRDAKKLETEIASANIKQEDLDLELVDVSELTQELKTANEHNQKLALKQKDFENLSRKIETNDEAIENCENEIERAKKKIAELKKDSENIDSEKSKITIFLQKNPVIDTSFIEEQIEQAGNQNMVVQRVGAVKSKKEELEKIKKLVTKKSTELDEIKIEECKRIASSNLPEGFELQIATDDSHEEGLYYKGLPFSELNQSTSEIMKATILIQQAINPNGLKIACIQRYESVGSAKRKEIEKFMKENDLQAIFEVMDTSKHELVISEKI